MKVEKVEQIKPKINIRKELKAEIIGMENKISGEIKCNQKLVLWEDE